MASRRKLQELGNGWKNVPPRTQMISHDEGMQSSERPLSPTSIAAAKIGKWR